MNNSFRKEGLDVLIELGDELQCRLLSVLPLYQTKPFHVVALTSVGNKFVTNNYDLYGLKGLEALKSLANS